MKTQKDLTCTVTVAGIESRPSQAERLPFLDPLSRVRNRRRLMSGWTRRDFFLPSNAESWREAAKLDS
jgi:hypothetical protein